MDEGAWVGFPRDYFSFFPARDDILNFVGQEEAATNRDALHGLSKGSPPWRAISAIRL